MNEELKNEIEKLIDEKLANYVLVLYNKMMKDLDISKLPPDGL